MILYYLNIITPSRVINVYIIPKIVKNNSRGPGWYEKYRITGIEELKKINEIWKKIINKE